VRPSWFLGVREKDEDEEKGEDDVVMGREVRLMVFCSALLRPDLTPVQAPFHFSRGSENYRIT
jgi:hypothetical protein